MFNREDRLSYTAETDFDAAIIGGGINGSCLYNQLCKTGFKVLLLDKGDFGCGTSQASAMMIWGGLLYLRNLEFLSVYMFSRDRDFLIQEIKDWVLPCQFRYIPSKNGGRNKYFVKLGLYLYWLLGLFNRKRPFSQNIFDEIFLLKEHLHNSSLLYEEAVINYSDSRFLLHWITSQSITDNVALNYCKLDSVEFSDKEKLWHLNLTDRLNNKEVTARSKLIINCAGVWTDNVNELANIKTPFKHVFGKGVFISFKRSSRLNLPMIFETGYLGDVISLIPWGPVALWGPTDELSDSISEGYSAKKDDIVFLLDHANKNLNKNLNESDVISIRTGVRPLAVKNTFNRDFTSLDISRFFKIFEDKESPWISVYGGKMTSCISMAKRISTLVFKYTTPTLHLKNVQESAQEEIDLVSFDGLSQKVPSVKWCIRNEFCCTLEDYLRRRTNISQWIPREGLGFNNEKLPLIKEIAVELSGNNEKGLENLKNYQEKVVKNFDSVIN